MGIHYFFIWLIDCGYTIELHRRGDSNEYPESMFEHVRIASLGDSNRYPKHTFHEKNKINQGFSFISICRLRILYNSKLIQWQNQRKNKRDLFEKCCSGH